MYLVFQVIYHFPYVDHLRRTFNRADLIPFLLQDTGVRPPGHFSFSRGYNLKVTPSYASLRHQPPVVSAPIGAYSHLYVSRLNCV